MAMLRGPIYWAKIVGKPSKGYAPTDPREWTFDLALNDDAVADMKKNGAAVYIKEPKNDNDHGGRPYIRFKRKETNAKGEPGTPYRIVDHQGKPWDGKTLIGNGSVCNIKMSYNEQTMGKNKGAFKPSAFALQVVKLEKYEGGEDFPTYDEDGQQESWD